MRTIVDRNIATCLLCLNPNLLDTSYLEGNDLPIVRCVYLLWDVFTNCEMCLPIVRCVYQLWDVFTNCEMCLPICLKLFAKKLFASLIYEWLFSLIASVCKHKSHHNMQLMTETWVWSENNCIRPQRQISNSIDVLNIFVSFSFSNM